MGRVTLQTIADRVGVSRTTVSNAYSRPDQLTDDLRKRILRAAEQLGYVGPNPAARSLRRGRSGAIGLLFTETLSYAFGDPYAVGFLQGLAESTEKAGVGLLIVPVPPGRTQEQSVRDAVVDGFCVYSLPDGHQTLDTMLRLNLPIVIVDEPYLPDLPFVGIDDGAAAALAAGHVIEFGHRTLGVAAFRLRHDAYDGWADIPRQRGGTFRQSRQRTEGYRAVCEQTGIDWEAVPAYEVAVNSRESGRRAGYRLLDQHPRPTAILAMSDQLALGVVDAARERGLHVPHDLSVVGFDDIPLAGPAGLTTVRQPMTEKGVTAGRLLLDPPGEGSQQVWLPHELVVRSTTGPPPLSAA